MIMVFKVEALEYRLNVDASLWDTRWDPGGVVMGKESSNWDLSPSGGLGRKAKVYLVLEAKENVFRQKESPVVPNSANR